MMLLWVESQKQFKCADRQHVLATITTTQKQPCVLGINIHRTPAAVDMIMSAVKAGTVVSKSSWGQLLQSGQSPSWSNHTLWP